MELRENSYITYIVNPKSGASSTTLLAHKFKDFLEEKGWRVEVRLTKSLEDAQLLANKAAVDRDCALVVACGGDGTIREVIQGLEGSETPLMILPGGTENLLANELGYDEHIETYYSAFTDGELRPLDIGVANAKCFTSVLGIGIDGEIVCRFNSNRKGHVSHVDYFWPIWRSIWTHRFPKLRIEADGEEVFRGRGMAYVGNISRYAIGLEILKNADYSDGLLDLCIYKCSTRHHLFKHSIFTLLKLHAKGGDVVYRQCKKVKVVCERGISLTQVDGDPGPALPLEIEIIPDAVNVLVPKRAKPAGIRTRLRRMVGFH